jgi:DNA replicative helicase MCM subunit Mcm2 (Cdc46/Mcm family)
MVSLSLYLYLYIYISLSLYSKAPSLPSPGRFARFTVNRDKCRAIDWQRIRLQEDFAELAAGNSGGAAQRRMPRTVDCDLKRSLVGSCVPGDVVTWK